MMGWLSGCVMIRPTDPYPCNDGGGVIPVKTGPDRSHSMIVQGPLTLAQAIETALSNNPEVAARRWEQRAAQAGYDQAWGAWLPKINATGSYYRHLDPQRILPVGVPGEPTILSRTLVSGDVVLTLPLFTGGRLINQMKAADLIRQAAEQRLARSREELVFNVTSLFNTILAQEHVIHSLEFSRETLQEHLNRINALIAVQKAANVDRLRMEVRLADIEQRWVREKNIQSIHHRALANFLGMTGHDDTVSLQGMLTIDSVEGLPKLDSAFEAAWKNRGDFRAARLALEVQAKSIDIARSGHLPVLSMVGAYGGRWAGEPTIGSGDKHGDLGRIGLMVEMPIFSGGTINAQIREQKARLAAAQERLRSLELLIRLEVETALLSVESAVKRAAAIQKSMAQARESLRIEQEKYNLSKGAIVDVLDSQAALLETETTYYRVLADYHTARAQLRLAMGEE